MLEKYALISFILIFIFLYLYVQVDSFYFDNSTQINQQLLSGISRVLEISPSRITKLTYEGDIAQGQLQVSFIIQEPNTGSQERNAKDSAILTNNLMVNGNFKVLINSKIITLSKLIKVKQPQNANTSFDNLGLKAISEYSNNKYLSIPNDESLTKFYKLDYDDNYNLMPKI